LLLDGAGEIVASASSHNDPTTSARAGALASRPSGMFEAADNLGRPTFWGVVPLAGSPLRLAVGLDQATVLAAYHRGTRQAAVLLAFTVLLTSSLIAFAGSGFFANPMRKLDRLLHLTLENMDQGIIAVDQNGRLPICNKRATQLLGLPRDFMSKGPSANEVLAYQASTGEFEALSTDVQGKLNPCLSGGIATSYERTRPDGTVLEIRTVPIPEGGWVRTYSDVTARSRAATELLRLATHDGLTGLCNRRHFDASLQIEVARSCRSGPPLSLLMIDVDHFKQYNDRYGHVAGDACLRRIAQLLHDACRRPSDLVARYGGEEFAVLLPETPLAAALQLAENVRRLLDAAALPHAGGQHGVVTVSIGAATLGDFATASAETFVAAADACLYAAKSAGRNQVHPVPCAEPLPLAS
jgi:diguanylate cyclase (GGDEF)-like protein